jgi:hypothetical protein
LSLHVFTSKETPSMPMKHFREYDNTKTEIGKFLEEIWTLSESKRFILPHHISIIADTFKRFATIK